jgi:hypothetical protein
MQQNWQYFIRSDTERLHVAGQMIAYPRFSPHDGQRIRNSMKMTHTIAEMNPINPSKRNALLMATAVIPKTKIKKENKVTK